MKPQPANDEAPEKRALQSATDKFAIAVKREQLYDEFESDWQSATRPSIESFLLRVPEKDREDILRELLAIELEQRLLRGEVTPFADYRGRFPDHAVAVESVYRSAMSSTQHRPPNVTRFQPIDRLGFGGQGEVWLMLDPEIDRRVAMKILQPSQKGIEPSLSSFRREAEVSGKLEHPNIVPVYDVTSELNELGQADPDSPCYVMRVFGDPRLHVAITAFHEHPRSAEDHGLLEALRSFERLQSPEHRLELEAQFKKYRFDPGQTCDQTLKAAVESILKEDSEAGTLTKAITKLHAGEWSESSLRKLLSRFQRICEGVAYAHSQGVIHRDLKPENVMLGEYGETLVADWGLAKVVGREEDQPAPCFRGTFCMSSLDANELPTEIGKVKGTPHYMSPEQAGGRVDELGPPTDIYSLGAILYYILVGKTAFKGPKTEEEIWEVLQQVCAGEFPRPTEVKSDVPKPLEAIAIKAMSLNPLDRYAKALDLAADVERWLNDEPVTAWSEPLIIRAKRWMKNHQTVVTSSAAAVVVATVTLSLMFIVVSRQKTEIARSLVREKKANESEHAQRLNADASREVAVRERNAAQSAREIAETNAEIAKKQSRLALSTINTMINGFDDELRTSQVGEAIRRRLTSTLLDRVDELSAEFLAVGDLEEANDDLLLNVADILQNIGIEKRSDNFIEQTLSTLTRKGAVALPAETKRGVDVALHILRRLRDKRRARLASAPNNIDYIHDLAYVHFALASALSSAGDQMGCLTECRESLHLVDKALLHGAAKARNTRLRCSALLLLCANQRDDVAERERCAALLIEAAKDHPNVEVAKCIQAFALFLEMWADADSGELRKGEQRLVALRLAVSKVPEEFGQYRDAFDLLARHMSISVGLDHQPITVKISEIEELLVVADRLEKVERLSRGASNTLLAAYQLAILACGQISAPQIAAEISVRRIALAQRLLDQDPTDRNAQWHICACKIDDAQVLANAKRTDDAEAAIHGMLDAITAQTSNDDAESVWLELEGTAAVVQCNIAHQRGDQEQVLKYLDIQNRANSRLVQLNPHKVIYRLTLTAGLWLAGDTCNDLGKNIDAIMYYEQALDQILQLPAENRDGNDGLKLRAGVLGSLYISHSALNENEKAKKYAALEIPIRRTLLALNSDNAQTQRDLDAAFSRTGSAAQELNRFDEAIEHYRQSIVIKKKQLANSGGLFGTLGKVLGQSASVSPPGADLKKEIAWCNEQIEFCQKAKLATGDWTSLDAAPMSDWESLLILRIQRFARVHDDKGLLDTADKLRQRESKSANELFLAAVCYSDALNLSYGWSGKGVFTPRPSDLEVERSPKQAELFKLTLDCLTESVAGGFSDGLGLETADGLILLRTEKSFDTIVMSAYRRAVNDALEAYQATNDSSALASLFDAHNRLGDAQAKRLQADDSLRSSFEMIEIGEKLAATRPKDSQFLQILSSSYLKVAERLGASGKPKEAIQHFNQGIGIAKRRAMELLPASSAARLIVASHYETLRAFAAALPDWQLAHEAASESIQHAHAAVALATNGEPVEWDFVFSFSQLGIACQQTDQLPKAREAFEKGSRLAKKLIDENPKSGKALQNGLALNEQLGDVAMALEDFYEANRRYEDAMGLARRALAVATKEKPVDVRLDPICDKQGNVRARLKDFDGALKCYEEALAIRQQIAITNAGDAAAQNDLMVSHFLIGEVRIQAEQYEVASESFVRGIDVLDRMITNGQDVETSKQKKASLEERLKFSTAAPVAAGDWDLILKVDDAALPQVLAFRMTLLAPQNRLAEIAQTGLKLRELANDAEDGPAIEQKGGLLYNAACANSLCAAMVTNNNPQPTQAEQTERKKYLDLSLICLKAAIAAGYDDLAHMELDADLISLRELPEYLALIKLLKEKKPQAVPQPAP